MPHHCQYSIQLVHPDMHHLALRYPHSLLYFLLMSEFDSSFDTLTCLLARPLLAR